MGIITASGTTVKIGPSVAESVDSVAEFEVLTYVTIGFLSNIGDYGDSASAVNFAVIGDGRVRKAKGARDAGTLQLTAAHIPDDAGQIAMDAAEGTNFNYALRIERPDAPVAGWSNTIDYMRVLVRSKRESIGQNDTVVTKVWDCEINSQIYRDPAAAP
jgi:hypothetical protein